MSVDSAAGPARCVAVVDFADQPVVDLGRHAAIVDCAVGPARCVVVDAVDQPVVDPAWHAVSADCAVGPATSVVAADAAGQHVAGRAVSVDSAVDPVLSAAVAGVADQHAVVVERVAVADVVPALGYAAVLVVSAVAAGVGPNLDGDLAGRLLKHPSHRMTPCLPQERSLVC